MKKVVLITSVLVIFLSIQVSAEIWNGIDFGNQEPDKIFLWDNFNRSDNTTVGDAIESTHFNITWEELEQGIGKCFIKNNISLCNSSSNNNNFARMENELNITVLANDGIIVYQVNWSIDNFEDTFITETRINGTKTMVSWRVSPTGEMQVRKNLTGFVDIGATLVTNRYYIIKAEFNRTNNLTEYFVNGTSFGKFDHFLAVGGQLEEGIITGAWTTADTTTQQTYQYDYVFVGTLVNATPSPPTPPTPPSNATFYNLTVVNDASIFQGFFDFIGSLANRVTQLFVEDLDATTATISNLNVTTEAIIPHDISRPARDLNVVYFNNNSRPLMVYGSVFIIHNNFEDNAKVILKSDGNNPPTTVVQNSGFNLTTSAGGKKRVAYFPFHMAIQPFHYYTIESSTSGSSSVSLDKWNEVEL